MNNIKYPENKTSRPITFRVYTDYFENILQLRSRKHYVAMRFLRPAVFSRTAPGGQYRKRKKKPEAFMACLPFTGDRVDAVTKCLTRCELYADYLTEPPTVG